MSLHVFSFLSIFLLAFSTEPLDMYTNLPSNLDSSIPDKNFVKPPQVDVIEEFPSSSKIAEKFSKKVWC